MKRLLLIIPELLLFAVFSISPIANEGMLCGMIFAVCLIVITLIFPMLKKLWEKRAVLFFSGNNHYRRDICSSTFGNDDRGYECKGRVPRSADSSWVSGDRR
jgi:hypothetical protein